MSILVLSFRGTVAEAVANRLHFPADKVLLDSNKAWLEQFVASVDFTAYEYILALGEYSGRDQQALRIETVCSSQFRNNKPNMRKVAIPYFFEPELPFKLASGIGNSWCNLLCYLILHKLASANVTFLHIPTKFDVTRACREIERQCLRPQKQRIL